MGVFINGSFGIGKTTVARLLADQLHDSVVATADHSALELADQTVGRIHRFEEAHAAPVA